MLHDLINKTGCIRSIALLQINIISIVGNRTLEALGNLKDSYDLVKDTITRDLC